MPTDDKTITVFGLGKMGLPIAVAYADAGYEVIGVDINPKVVTKVNNGETWFREPGLDEKLERVINHNSLKATTDSGSAVELSDAIIVIVPLLLTENKGEDFSAIFDVTKKIGQKLRKDQIVIYETTLPPKTTENVIRPQLEQLSKLSAGKDFGLFASPERVYSLHVFEEMKKMKKVLGPCKNSKRLFIKRAKKLLKTVYKAGIVLVEDATTAEMTKLAETSFRAVNIALANELAKLTDEMEVNVEEVIRAANTHRYTNILKPGAGVGGHCMPVYPHFLINRYPDLTKLIKEGQEINESMPEYVLDRLKRGVEEQKGSLEDLSILILGLAYRPNVKEDMNSPALQMIAELKGKVQDLAVYDPVFSPEEIREICQTDYWKPEEGLENFQYDVVIIATGYTEFKEIVKELPSSLVLIDGRNIITNTDRFSVYKGVGKGS